MIVIWLKRRGFDLVLCFLLVEDWASWIGGDGVVLCARENTAP